MPSPNIANFNYTAEFDLAAATPVLNLDDASTYIGGGATLVQGINFKVIAPNGAVLHNNTGFITPDIVPATPVTLVVNLPLFNGEIIWGIYTIIGTIKDQDATLYTLTKTPLICKPVCDCGDCDGMDARVNIKFDCLQSTLFVQDVTPFVYQGIVGTPTYDITIKYPLGSGVDDVTSSLGSFSLTPLYNGEYTFDVDDTASYDLGSDVTVIIGYTKIFTKNSFCSVSLCGIYCAWDEYIKKWQALTKSGNPLAATFEKNVFRLAILIPKIQLGLQCGEDVGKDAKEVESITGSKCSCECGERIPPSGVGSGQTIDVVANGGDIVVTETTVGNNTVFYVSDTSYDIQPALGQTGVTITSSTAGDTKTFYIEVCADELPICNSTNIRNGLGGNTNVSDGSPLSDIWAAVNTAIDNILTAPVWQPIVLNVAFNNVITAQYSRDKWGTVALRGFISSAGAVTTDQTVGSVPFSASNNYPPSRITVKSFVATAGVMLSTFYLTIDTAGVITVDSVPSGNTPAGTVFISLDGISYSTTT